MKQLLTLTSSLALSVVLLTTQAQAPTSQAKPAPKTAGKRATTYYPGTKVPLDGKALGKKMVQKSKPADNILTRVDQLPRPANQ